MRGGRGEGGRREGRGLGRGGCREGEVRKMGKEWREGAGKARGGRQGERGGRGGRGGSAPPLFSLTHLQPQPTRSNPDQRSSAFPAPHRHPCLPSATLTSLCPPPFTPCVPLPPPPHTQSKSPRVHLPTRSKSDQRSSALPAPHHPHPPPLVFPHPPAIPTLNACSTPLNRASRLESTSLPGAIQVSAAVHSQLLSTSRHGSAPSSFTSQCILEGQAWQEAPQGSGSSGEGGSPGYSFSGSGAALGLAVPQSPSRFAGAAVSGSAAAARRRIKQRSTLDNPHPGCGGYGANAAYGHGNVAGAAGGFEGVFGGYGGGQGVGCVGWGRGEGRVLAAGEGGRGSSGGGTAGEAWQYRGETELRGRPPLHTYILQVV